VPPEDTELGVTTLLGVANVTIKRLLTRQAATPGTRARRAHQVVCWRERNVSRKTMPDRTDKLSSKHETQATLAAELNPYNHEVWPYAKRPPALLLDALKSAKHGLAGAARLHHASRFPFSRTVLPGLRSLD
jgi:hypothetical protein